MLARIHARAAIAAKNSAHRSRIGEVLRHAEQLNAEAQADSKQFSGATTSHKPISSARQVNLLRQSQQLISQHVPASAAAAAAKRIAALAGKRSPGAKLATMDDPDAVLDLNPQVAFPPTHQAGNQWDAQPVPKVLDCGPLSNNCNTKQGGEYFARHNKGDRSPDTNKAARPRVNTVSVCIYVGVWVCVCVGREKQRRRSPQRVKILRSQLATKLSLLLD